MSNNEKEMRLNTLKQKQSLPLENKVLLAKQRIREWYEYWEERGENVYVSFSGGKDSTVLAHLVKEEYPDVPLVFSDTGLEYPELKEFAMSMANEVVKPKYSFRQIVTKYGYPVVSKETSKRIEGARMYDPEKSKTKWHEHNFAERWKYLVDSDFRISDKCCYHMKKAPLKKYQKENKSHPYIGIMACESELRKRSFAGHGCNAYSDEGSSNPLMTWLENDVLEYIVKNDIPYCREVYGDIIPDGRGGTEPH